MSPTSGPRRIRELRLATFPTLHGQGAVVRIFADDTRLQSGTSVRVIADGQSMLVKAETDYENNVAVVAAKLAKYAT